MLCHTAAEALNNSKLCIQKKKSRFEVSNLRLSKISLWGDVVKRQHLIGPSLYTVGTDWCFSGWTKLETDELNWLREITERVFIAPSIGIKLHKFLLHLYSLIFRFPSGKLWGKQVFFIPCEEIMDGPQFRETQDSGSLRSPDDIQWTHTHAHTQLTHHCLWVGHLCLILVLSSTVPHKINFMMQIVNLT